jgi:predicted nucleic acid-binding Zn ribbon protein
MAAALMAADGNEQRRRIRRSALVWMAVAAAFYVGFIVMMLVRASR